MRIVLFRGRVIVVVHVWPFVAMLALLAALKWTGALDEVWGAVDYTLRAFHHFLFEH